ncbi:MAG: hypothetical protein ACOY3P_26380, partial [Planctomycetota bacterium]
LIKDQYQHDLEKKPRQASALSEHPKMHQTTLDSENSFREVAHMRLPGNSAAHAESSFPLYRPSVPPHSSRCRDGTRRKLEFRAFTELCATQKGQ